MKKLLAPAVLLSLLLTGCGAKLLPSGDEITQAVLMRTMGVDVGEKQAVKVTMASGLQKASPDGEPTEPLVLAQEGDSISAARVDLQGQGSQDIFYGHITGCLIGEEIAQRGLYGLIDYLERDFDTRLSTNLFVIRAGEAGKVMDALSTKEQSASERLDAIARDYQLLSNGCACSCLELITQLEDNGMALLPALTLEEEPGKRQDVETAGYAILREGALTGWVETDYAAGVNLLLGCSGRSIWEVELEDGSLADLQVNNADCALSGTWQGEKLTGLTVKLAAQASLAQMDGTDCPCDESTTKALEQGLSQQLEQLCREVLSECRQQGDFLHLRQTLSLKQPWKKMALEALNADWLSDVEITVKADCTVTRSYDVGKPLEAQREEISNGTG